MFRRSFVLGAALVALSVSILFFVRLFSVPPSHRPPIPPVPSSVEALPSGGISDFLSRFGLAPWSKPSIFPVAVIIENHEDARPHQRGLSDALFVGEFLVEGYISRFVAFFDREHLPEQTGPVRSLRPYFLSVIEPWASALLFAGGSPEALQNLEESPVPWVNVLGVDDAPLRDRSVPAPHNMFLRSEHVRALVGHAARRRIVWPPYRIGPSPAGSGAYVIHLQFFSPLHDVMYTYDTIQEAYIRRSGSVSEQGKPANVLILEVPIVSEGEYGRLAINPDGRSRVLLFRSGVLQHGFWERSSDGPFRFFIADGSPLLFAPGQTWMTVLPSLERVRWE
ncbi:hypothetical protein A3H22_04040 [Candidatus Peribacteria bacterium RIFCSPLOWO2_12_FULL_55_15]|nr:MAG: hypothetical protein A2789_03825 [Candidatus Peribacteria bacterium RIFCSPHIGHO2_01_FULL_54_22]OGJ63184.1 MAG: hypothetical protein A3D12_03495 [Candidatus Peribacteria bacterium RIFCSPHIGHO2_02_FULL_55_24]OGJ64183.1 MAG: hypothetical protein A3E47_03895 [Candidatus Peribacteria bacterium RIFCSPHIGHO2_12_FULL_54_10]OGJ68533.1 MAG: hypothetical protein A2947_01335 [Candidatus Peribacteria bacterium RIFCSPLOWO2_01_FULL_54_110]OGJ69153.1 MAG: hypothetical protein A3H90_01110 [Candidatus Pe